MSDQAQRCPKCKIPFYEDIPSQAIDLQLIRKQGSCYVCQFEQSMQEKLARLRAQSRREIDDGRKLEVHPRLRGL